jgi:carbonic anhydrase
MPEIFEKIFVNNKKWVQEKLESDPEYFKKLSLGQKPPILWIGCSDSRVPANEITGTNPGEVFVHRNIANMVIHTDMSLLSVLDYAVNVLKVKHIIVCGHYGCGGVLAALGNQQIGLIDNWLRNIKDVYRLHKYEIDSLETDEQKGRKLVELNVQEQVYNLVKTSIVQSAWTNQQELFVHGLVYDVGNGILQDLHVSVSNNSKIDQVYKFSSIEI